MLKVTADGVGGLGDRLQFLLGVKMMDDAMMLLMLAYRSGTAGVF